MNVEVNLSVLCTLDMMRTLVEQLAAQKTLAEAIGEHKAESCNSYEIAEDLNIQSNILDGVILLARQFSEDLKVKKQALEGADTCTSLHSI